MSFRLKTMRIRRIVPATMLRPNSGVSWDFHYRRTKFFISHVWSPPKNILCPVTFFGTKIPMLSAPFIDGSPYLFYAKNICHLYSLLAPIRTIVNSILQGWTTRMTMFFVIAVAEIRLTNALSSQKMTLYPVSFHRASIPTETNLPHDLKEDYILMATWFCVKTIKSHSKKKFGRRI